jgi:hypothetical protein
MQKILLCLLLMPTILFAQKGVKRMVTFNLKSPKTFYTIFPSDTILLYGKPNEIKLRVSGNKKKSYSLCITNGTISGSDSSYVIHVSSGLQALLVITEKQPDGSRKEVLNKRYYIKRIPEPYVLVCGVKGDSVISSNKLFRDDLLWAYSPHHNKKLKVVSFQAVLPNGESVDTLNSDVNHFTLDMRRDITKLKPGDIVYFNNIICEMPDGEKKMLKPIQIYIEDENKLKTGMGFK